MDNIKTVFLSDNKNKEKSKRKVTNTQEWENNVNNLDKDKQLELLNQITNKDNEKNDTIHALIKKGIQTKIQGYKNQDVKKKILVEDIFVDFQYILELISKSMLECYYCNNICSLLYENVKDPNQWTLDRLDNKYGHNKGNVVISCLSCNLKRKTIHHRRYQFTKQLQITKNET